MKSFKRHIKETYKDSGLGKWFGKGGKGGKSEGGWDRYNTKGERVGKCGDSDEGDAYAACLSAEKAKKLGKEGIADFVKRKRAAQKKSGDAKKGGESKKGQKPTFVKTKANEECDCDKQIIEEAEYQGKKVKLNDPFRTPGQKKKFAVYVKNESGTVVIVRFGDPNMEIKRDDDNRRKNFRARHNCDDPGPKWKARYWSCYQWRAGAKVDS